MRMRVCYLDSHEAEMCCYLVVHIENLLRPFQLFYFHLWLIYWPSLVIERKSFSTFQFISGLFKKLCMKLWFS
jgi:hypothetical protein